MDSQITREKSKTIKFIAVLIMIILHVFGFPTRIESYTYKSLFHIGSIPVERYLATGSSIVVHLFLFISGYGLYLQGEQSYKKIYKRLKSLYIEYWTVILIFIPVGYLMKIYKFNMIEFLGNFIGVISSYNAEWWFLKAYVIYILTYPLSRKMMRKNSKLTLILGMGITGSGMILGKLIRADLLPNNLFLGILSSTLEYYYPFICGMFIVENSIFDKFIKVLEEKHINGKILFVILVLFLCWIEKFNYIRHAFNFVLVPLFIVLLSLFEIERNKFILWISQYTTGVWLTHSFFCYYYFKGLTFFPRYSVLIFIWITILSVICSVIIEKLKKIVFFRKGM